MRQYKRIKRNAISRSVTVRNLHLSTRSSRIYLGYPESDVSTEI
jgi:hypothetical protein